MTNPLQKPEREERYSTISKIDYETYMSRVSDREETIEAKLEVIRHFLEQENARENLTTPEKDKLKKIAKHLSDAEQESQKLTGKAGLMTSMGFGGLTATARQTYNDSRQDFKYTSDKQVLGSEGLGNAANAVSSFFKGVKSFFVNIPTSVKGLIKVNASKRAQVNQAENIDEALKEMENIKLTRAMASRTSIDKMAAAGMATPQPGHTPRAVMDVAAAMADVNVKEPGQESPRASVEKDLPAPSASDSKARSKGP